MIGVLVVAFSGGLEADGWIVWTKDGGEVLESGEGAYEWIAIFRKGAYMGLLRSPFQCVLLSEGMNPLDAALEAGKI